ncbi:hypothetical protein [Pseudomonas gingeri]|uniref:hypothetical protein n=1 Tax=Pseudomonas gingeri TaxID=117681 RepID=UPI003FA3425A
MTSKIIESLRGDLAALHDAGVIDQVTMREFDAICPPPVREFSATDQVPASGITVQPARIRASPAHHGIDRA